MLESEQDLCTSLAMVPFRSVESWDVTGLSLNLSLNFLGAARTGSTLRIISRTTNVGRNVASIACRVEVIPVVGVASASATSTTTSTTTTNNQQYAKVVATGSHLKFNAFAKSSGRQEVEVAQQEDREVRDASTRGFKTFPRAASSAL
ncbi:hypothetical protein IE81DRAFT_42670 [Ceraceosorus guamensis]|uniref:Thioesterase domain-containing protein n=1 Tax=Ceraceosorus guamensis TaxID=1522189 RepID=A0A316VNT4_9BASI|nr:hypothetical protein IE81DRAFT_42670 [Ceraceosorus guamensis]PWN39192.1 hypothetical protein IE81DRAFT_42670 [Ceraceosorus guamensis]